MPWDEKRNKKIRILSEDYKEKFHNHEHPVGQQERVVNGHRKINRHTAEWKKSRKDGNVKES